MAGWLASRLDEFRQATLWARRRGAIAGEAALDLWALSDVVPRVIDLIVEPVYRPRKAGGETYRVRRRALPLEAVDQVDCIAVLSPFATIQDCINAGTSGREITQAIDTAQARELINRREARGVGCPRVGYAATSRPASSSRCLDTPGAHEDGCPSAVARKCSRSRQNVGD